MKYFGTDGFRGEANVTLTAEHAFKIGRFLGHYYQNEDHRVRVLVGKDTRLSGYMYETALAAGLTASGADVYEIHVTTTPSISYLIRQQNFDLGIMITASHNPYTDNGIKVINGTGHKLEEEVEIEMEKYMERFRRFRMLPAKIWDGVLITRREKRSTRCILRIW
mgnify:CR=1 FL=1